MARYREIRESLDTGDLILFSGKGGASTGVKWFTESKWSHVGMVMRLAEWDMALLWEATTLADLRDVVRGIAHQGVQLVALSQRVASYDGEMSYRRLEAERSPAMLHALVELRRELKDRPYEQSKLELLRSAYEGPLGHNEEDLSSLFCSELIAESYQRMGLLPSAGGLASNEYTPRDFSAAGERLELLGGARLGPELLIERG